MPAHEVQQRKYDDLLVVRGAASGREADDLEERCELDGDVERRATRDEPCPLHDAERDRRNVGEVFERGK